MLVVVAVALVLVIGVLAVTSSTEQQDRPAWYPPTGAVVAPAVETSSPGADANGGPDALSTTTGRPPASTVEDSNTTLPRPGPATAPTSTNAPSEESDEREGATVPGWRLVAGLPRHRGALSDVDVVTGAGTETFVAAGADQHGALVVAANGPDSWRELPRKGLPPESYARSVAATQDAVVVAGADAGGPAVWELAGDSWRRASVDGAVEGRAVFADVAVRGGTWVVVGFDGDATGFWVRTPGSERFAAVDPRAVTGLRAEQTLVREVVATDAGFIAVGQAGGRAVRWASVDGVDWSGEPLVASEEATAMGVTADGKTIVGYDASGGVVWVERAKERHLVRLPPPSDAPQLAETVAVRSGRTVVFGVEAGSVRCWETSDAQRPPRRCARSTSLDAAMSIGAVVAHRGGLLAVGQATGDGSGQIGIWKLVDE